VASLSCKARWNLMLPGSEFYPVRSSFISPKLFHCRLCPSFGRECAHGQRVNFRAHAISECQIHQLMLLYLIFAGELRAYDDRFEVLAIIAQHFHMIAGQAIHDVVS
jgi:hypothetical protein